MKVSNLYCLVVAFTIGASIVSCEQVPDCAQESSYTILKVKLFDKDSLTEEKVKFDSIKAVGSDSLFFTSEDSLSIYAVELNSSLTSSTFLFYSGNNVDSLNVSYDKAVTVPFEECGPIIDISNINIENSTFDSTVLINDFTNINFSENIEIYQ